MFWRVKVGCGVAGSGLAVEVRYGEAWFVLVGRSRLGKVRRGVDWRGGHGEFGRGLVAFGEAVLVCLGTVRRGTARRGGHGGVGLGQERRGLAVEARRVTAWSGMFWRSRLGPVRSFSVRLGGRV
jgi:hypothetical protein